MAPDLTICILTYETPDPILDACLRAVETAVQHAACSVEVLLIDNGSARRPAASARAGVTAVHMPTNGGFGRGMNEGVRRARGRYVLCLNPDARLTPTALSTILEVLQDDGGGQALFCCWLVSGGRVQVDALMLWWWSSGRLLRRRAYRQWLEQHQHLDLVPVQKVSGGALFAAKEVLRDLGPFDETFFLYGEDVDLSIRAAAAGLGLYAVPRAAVEHTGGASTTATSAFVEQARIDAALRLFARHKSAAAGLLARAELLAVTLVGLAGTRHGGSSGSRTGRLARLAELRRWGLRREAPRYHDE